MANLSAKNNDLFKDVDPAQIEQVSLNESVAFREGDIIFQTGEPAENMYLIVNGEVKLKIQSGLGAPVIVRRKADQYFGETELTANTVRKSSSVAETDCILIVLSKTDALRLMDISPQFKQNILGGSKTPEGIRRRDILFSSNTDKISDIPFLKNDKINFNDSEYDLSDSLNNEETPQVPDTSSLPMNEILLPPGMSQPEEAVSENIEPDNFDYSQSFQDIQDPLTGNPFLSPEPEEEQINYFSNQFPSEIEEQKNPFSSEPDESHPFFSEPEESQNPFFSEPDDFQNPFPPEPEIPLENIPDENENKFSFPPDEIKPVNDLPEQNVPFENFVPDLDSDIPEVPAQKEISIDETYLDILVAVQKIGSSIKFEELFVNVTEAVTDIVKCASAVLYLADTKRDILLNSENQIFDTGNSVPGICYASGEISYDENSLSIPVKNKAGVIEGVLQLNDSLKGNFDNKDEQIIKAVIPFIADVIENSRLLSADIDKYKIESLAVGSKLFSSDIKRPLLMIRHYVEYLKQKENGDEYLKILDLISEQAGSVLDLTQTLKEFSEGSLHPNLIESEITLVMDEFLALLAEYTDSRKVKVLRKYEGQGTALIDKRKLYQAIYQIVKNACDAMPGSGKIYFTVRRTDPNLEIEIKDEGTGIAEDIYSEILNPFVTSKKDAAGLGLTIAKDIIKKHKGEIQYSSQPGEGSIFKIILPAADIF